MFTNCRILDNFYYICAQNAQCCARITKSDMEIQRYNRLNIVLAEKERAGTWLSEQMGHNFFDKRVQSRARSGYAERRKSRTKFNISTVSRWMTNKVQPSMEQFYEIALHLDVDGKELLVSSKKYHRK